MPLTVTHNEPRSTSGPACCFVFVYRLGLGYPVGPTLSSRPHRAQQSHHRAALGGVPRQSPNRPIAHRIQSRRERPELLRVRRFRFGIGGVRRPSLRRLPCRDTPLHYAARNSASDHIAELLMRGADGAVQANDG